MLGGMGMLVGVELHYVVGTGRAGSYAPLSLSYLRLQVAASTQLHLWTSAHSLAVKVDLRGHSPHSPPAFLKQGGSLLLRIAQLIF